MKRAITRADSENPVADRAGTAGHGPLSSVLSQLLVVGACLACALFYALPYHSRLSMPPGDDAYFYVGAIRTVARLGLASPELAARPAYPLTGALLASVSGVSVWIVVVAVPVAMAIALGLAGGALAGRWGVRGPGIALFSALVATSGVIGRLVSSKSENIMALWLIAVMLAVALWMEGRERWIVVAFFSALGALTEWPLLVAFLAILAAQSVLGRIRVRGRPIAGPAPAGLVRGAVLGVGAGLVAVLAWSGGHLTIQNLPAAFLYSARLKYELSLMWPSLTVVLTAVGWWAARRHGSREVEPVRQLLTMWLVLTGAVILVGIARVPLPTYRALGLALPVALGASATALVAAAWIRAGGHVVVRWLAVGLSASIALLSVIPAATMWYQRIPAPVSPADLFEMQAAAGYALDLPRGESAVVVVNLNPIHYLAYQRLAADLLPPEDGDRLLVFVGPSRDALAGRPPVGRTPQQAAFLKRLFAPLRGPLAAGAPVLTGSRLDGAGFRAAVAAGSPRLGDDVAVLRGPAPAANPPPGPVSAPVLRSWLIFGFAILSLALFVAAGFGWSVLVMRRAPPIVRFALAPAFGVAAISLAALVPERLGVAPGRVAAGVELAVVLVASGAAWARGALARPATETRS